MSQKHIRSLIREMLENEFAFIKEEALTQEYLKSRIPFLKEFTLQEDRPAGESPRLIYFTKDQYNNNIEYTAPDASVKVRFSHLNFFAKFTYALLDRNGRKIHQFNINLDVLSIVEKEADNMHSHLVGSMLEMIIKKKSNELSKDYEFEDRGQGISNEWMDKTINDINKRIFEYAEMIQMFGTNFIGY